MTYTWRGKGEENKGNNKKQAKKMKKKYSSKHSFAAQAIKNYIQIIYANVTFFNRAIIKTQRNQVAMIPSLKIKKMS